MQTSVSAFSLSVVEQCWNTEEVNLLLTQKHGVTVAECDAKIPRVRLALDCHMKYVRHFIIYSHFMMQVYYSTYFSVLEWFKCSKCCKGLVGWWLEGGWSELLRSVFHDIETYGRLSRVCHSSCNICWSVVCIFQLS